MPQVTPEYLAERRSSILAAARRCFAARGFHSTSMPDICAEAGMSAGGVYRYFDGKDELIRELAETAMAPVLRALREAADADPMPGPAGIIDLIHRTLLTDGASTATAPFMLQVWAEVVHNPGLRESQRRHTTELLDLLSAFTRRWADLDEESARAAARALTAMSLGTFLMQNVVEVDGEPTSATTLLDSLNGIICRSDHGG
ncbi:TetR/AcrR family transcriptional regulator [Streptomyces shenzhenensis]|uniref:TetR/AcrR family transcriptional regulator n=1 Tax=Streptomyces shenzhenensis TaxID=943815 RepID=UPI00380CDBF1